ncbi:unnamed protein product [Rangifer tarandus platyrhynchus]|uniref:Uncharacterized protein n=1 Tax=Rangifer tarandus platyrhynchus TaxID=3082113 RepID=A0ABN8YFV7_RANTA|nr:unnamed protein product [Rangifer tarandus platyrhynchus]
MHTQRPRWGGVGGAPWFLSGPAQPLPLWPGLWGPRPPGKSCTRGYWGPGFSGAAVTEIYVFVLNHDEGVKERQPLPEMEKWSVGSPGLSPGLQPPAQPLTAWPAASPQALRLQRLCEHGSGWTRCSPTGHGVNNLWAPWEPGALPNPHSPIHHPSIHPPIHPSIQKCLLSALSCWAPHPLHLGHPSPHPHPLQWSSAQIGFVWPCCDFQTFDFLEKPRFLLFWKNG